MGSVRLLCEVSLPLLMPMTIKGPITPATVSAAVALQRGTLCSSHKHVQGPKPRLSRGDLKTSSLELRRSRTEGSSVILTRSAGQDDERAPLSRNEVVDLLTAAVNTLLKAENQDRLRERLGRKRQLSDPKRSTPLLQSLDVVQWTASPAPIDALQDLEVTVLAADDNDYGRNISDQEPPQSTIRKEENKAKPIAELHNMSALLQTQEQSKSIQSTESSSESVENRGDSSLTSIRRLKVLNVHSYVHNALRESALRSWLHSRKIEE